MLKLYYAVVRWFKRPPTSKILLVDNSGLVYYDKFWDLNIPVAGVSSWGEWIRTDDENRPVSKDELDDCPF